MSADTDLGYARKVGHVLVCFGPWILAETIESGSIGLYFGVADKVGRSGDFVDDKND